MRARDSRTRSPGRTAGSSGGLNAAGRAGPRAGGHHARRPPRCRRPRRFAPPVHRSRPVYVGLAHAFLHLVLTPWSRSSRPGSPDRVLGSSPGTDDRDVSPGGRQDFPSRESSCETGDDLRTCCAFNERVASAIDSPPSFHLLAKPTGAICNLDCSYCREGTMSAMAELLAQNRAPPEVMDLYAAQDARRGRNDPCTCGSGRKWKHCHGVRALSSDH